MSVEVKNLPNLSVFPDFTYEKYEGKAAHQGNMCYVLTGRIQLTVSERLVCVIKALAATILTFGVGLFLSQVQEFWKSALYGTKQVKAYGTIDQIPDSIKAAVLNAGNVDDPKPANNDSKPLKPAKLTQEEAWELIADESIELEQLPLHLKQDPIFLLDVVKKCYFGIALTTKYSIYNQILALPASHPLFNNEDFLLGLIAPCPLLVKKFPDHFINNKEFLLKAIDVNSAITRIIPLPEAYIGDEEVILRWIRFNTSDSGRFDTFNRISADLKKNSNLEAELTLSDYNLGEFIKCQSSNFDDENLTLFLIERDPTIFPLLPESKRCDRSFMIKAVKANIKTFDYIPTDLRHDADFVLELIENLIEINNSVSSELAMKNFISVLILGKNPLYADPGFIEKAIRKSLIIEFLPARLLNNRDFLLKILDLPGLNNNVNRNTRKYLPKTFVNDKEIILKWISIKLEPEDMDNISSAIKKDPEFIKVAKELYSSFEMLLEYDHMRQANEEQALQFVKEDPTNIFNLHPKLQNNQEFLIKCLKENWEVNQSIKSLPAAQLTKGAQEAFILKIVEHTGKIPSWIEFYSGKFWKNEKDVIELIKLVKDPEVFVDMIVKARSHLTFFEAFKNIDSLPDNLANDLHVIFSLVCQDKSFARFASKKLQEDRQFQAKLKKMLADG